jgi:hypothetical protein
VLIIHLAEFAGRSGLAGFMNAYGLTGDAAEVGTHRGEFAADFLRTWRGKRLYCIDDWRADYGDPAGKGDREGDERHARLRLRRWPKKAAVIKQDSLTAAARFPDESLDMVYLDADHRAEAVTADLLAWWPKVKDGGLLAGHDIICPGEPLGGWGQTVQPAVFGFAAERFLTVFLIPERGWPWSYYMIKS